MSDLYLFLGGGVTFGFCVAALFFLRFWKSTRDSLFLAFAICFLLLGIGQALVSFSNMPVEERSPLFLLRLIAFALVIAAICWKNRSSRRSG